MDLLKRIKRKFKTVLLLVTLLFSLCMVSSPCMAILVQNPFRFAQALTLFLKSSITTGLILSATIKINNFIDDIQHNVMGGINTNPTINTNLQARPDIDQTQGYTQYSETSSANKQMDNPDTFGAQLSAYKQSSTITTSDTYGPKNKKIGSYSTTNASVLRLHDINTEDSDRSSKQVVANLTNQNTGIPRPKPGLIATPASIKFKAQSDATLTEASVAADHYNKVRTERQAIEIGGKVSSTADNSKKTLGVTEAADVNMQANPTVGQKIVAGMTAIVSSSNTLDQVNGNVNDVGNSMAVTNSKMARAAKPTMEGLANQAENEQPGTLNNATGK